MGADVTLVIRGKFDSWRRGRDFNPADFVFTNEIGKTATIVNKYAVLVVRYSVTDGSGW